MPTETLRIPHTVYGRELYHKLVNTIMEDYVGNPYSVRKEGIFKTVQKIALTEFKCNILDPSKIHKEEKRFVCVFQDKSNYIACLLKL